MLPYWRLSAYYFFYFAFIGTYSPYFGLYLADLGLRAWDIGVLMSLMQVMRLVAPNLWGWLADRLGRRVPIMRWAALASCLGFSGLFFTTRFEGMLIALAVLAFFWTASLPLIEALTLAHLRSQMSRYGSVRLWGSLGFVAAVLGVGYVLDVAPVGVLLPILMAALGGILLTSLFTPEAPVVHHAPARSSLAEVLRRPCVRWFLASAFFMSAAHGALYVFYSLHLVQHGYSKSLVGWLWTLGVLVEIVVFLAMPQLFRRFSLKRILVVSFVCAVVRFVAIGWGVGSLVVIALAQLLHGATFGAHHAAAMAVINRWFGVSHQARGQALYGSLSFGAGGIVGGVLSGWMWESAGPALTFTMSSVFALIGLWLAVCTRFDEGETRDVV